MPVMPLTVLGELEKMIDLPKNCTNIVITLGIDELATVECTYYTDLKKQELTNKKFKLVECE